MDIGLLCRHSVLLCVFDQHFGVWYPGSSRCTLTQEEAWCRQRKSSLFAALDIKTLTHQQSLMAGIAVLTLCLFVYSIVDIIQSGLAISPASIYVTQAGYTAMYWIQSFARAFAFITVIVIAKNAAWRSNMFAENDPVEQQYAYYQQEPPVYAGPGQHA